MFDIKKLVRSLVYDCFPEIAPGGDDSWPSTMLHRLALTSERLAALCTLVQGSAKRRGTVVLLPPKEFKGPGFMSMTVVSTGREPTHGSLSEEGRVQFPMHWSLPAGGWLVSHGCTLVDVFVGNQHQNQAPDSNYCLLTDEAPLGMQLQARVRFD